MRTYIVCMQCQMEDGVPNPASFTTAPIPDNGVIETICPRGHQRFTIIQQMRFELLSELAMFAIVDGYHREAVASFTASLERLYEFYVEVACRRLRIDTEQYQVAWKPLLRSSERQLGAFSLVYLLENKIAPPLLPQKNTEFRNKVIHQGYFPDRSEAIAFGQAVADCAVPVLDLLASERYEDACQAAVWAYLRQRTSTLPPGTYNTMGILTPFGLDAERLGPIDMMRLVEDHAKRPRMDQFVPQAREWLEMHRDSQLQKRTD